MADNPEASHPYVIDAAPVPTFHANMFGIAFWPEEVVLSLGQRNVVDRAQGREVVKIYASHAMMKRLSTGLLEAIREYEENFGEIHTDIADRLTPEGRKRFGLDQEGSDNV